MADRAIATTDTLATFRREFNATCRDIGTIADVLSASGYIASSTDVVEAIVAINTELPEIKTDAFIFPGRVMAFEGATDDAYETTITFTEPTADRTHTLPNADGTIVLEDTTDTFTNKTLTAPTITSGVLNTGVSGTAVLDQDTLSSDSATQLATQQSIKAYVDNQIDADMDLVFAGDSGGNLQITMDSETMTWAGGTNITTAASSNTVTINLSANVVRDDATQTLTNKTFTSPTIDTMVSGGYYTLASGLHLGATGIVFEGATDDAYETTLTCVDPTADRVITIPNSTMTLLTTATHANKSNVISKCIALG